MALPGRIEEVSGEWLTAALRDSGRIAGDGQVAITAAGPLATGTAYSTVMSRIELEGPDGTPPSAVVKLPVTTEIRQVLDGVGAYVREVTFYSELARDVPVRVPETYVVATEEGSTDFVLMIEDLSSFEPADQLEGLTVEQMEAAIDALAAFHAWSWEHERLAGLADRFPPLDSEMGRGTYGQFSQFFGLAWQAARELPMVPEEVKVFGDRYGELAPFFIEQLATPRTITHGEFRADNLFLGQDGELVMLDFQTVAQQAGIVDVAYLVAGSLALEVRRGRDEELVRRYHAAIETNGVAVEGPGGYTFERAWEQYRIALPYNLMLSGLAFSQYEQTDDRGKQLLVEMVARACDAIISNRSLELLP
jgi:hypothetical protein